MKKIAILLLFLLLFPTKSFSAQGFTKEDRERLVRLEATLKVFMQQVDKRFEQVDKRIMELRMDMNKSGIFTTMLFKIGLAYWERRIQDLDKKHSGLYSGTISFRIFLIR